MDKKIIWSSGASVLIASILILGIGELTGNVDIIKEKTYGCEERGIVMPCDRLSSYYGLPNGKCWNEELGNKLCKSGWVQDFEVIDEIEIKETQPEKEVVEIYISNIGKQYLCNTKKCIQIR